jgi:hypothetical protein
MIGICRVLRVNRVEVGVGVGVGGGGFGGMNEHSLFI